MLEIEEVKISVIIPVYNCELYLHRCIDSVLNQTYKELEIICVDDGSTDKSGIILEKYAKADSRLVVIHNENQGPTPARKSALSVATGEYIFCLDSDDYIDRDMIENMVEMATSNNLDLVCCGCCKEYEKFSENIYDNIPEGIHNISAYINEHGIVRTDIFFEMNLLPTLANKIIRRTLANKYLMLVGDEINFGEDRVVSYLIFLDIENIGEIKKPYYHYRMRVNSITHTRMEDNDDSIKKVYDFLIIYTVNTRQIFTTILQQLAYDEIWLYLINQPHKIIEYKNGNLSLYGKITSRERVVLYGAGRVGVSLYNFIINYTQIKIVAWVDLNENEFTQSPEILQNIDYDKVLIGVASYTVLESIKIDLMKYNVPKDKIMQIDIRLIQDKANDIIEQRKSFLIV